MSTPPTGQVVTITKRGVDRNEIRGRLVGVIPAGKLPTDEWAVDLRGRAQSATKHDRWIIATSPQRNRVVVMDENMEYKIGLNKVLV